MEASKRVPADGPGRKGLRERYVYATEGRKKHVNGSSHLPITEAEKYDTAVAGARARGRAPGGVE